MPVHSMPMPFPLLIESHQCPPPIPFCLQVGYWNEKYVHTATYSPLNETQLLNKTYIVTTILVSPATCRNAYMLRVSVCVCVCNNAPPQSCIWMIRSSFENEHPNKIAQSVLQSLSHLGLLN